jgi:hypothetical protein
MNNLFVESKPVLYILTPCYGGMCHVDFTICLINTLKLLEKYNIPVHVEFCKNDSLVTRARNNLVAKAMADEAMTHLIFIDNDIVWNPLDIIRLCMANKPIVGGVYPLKKYNWENITNIEGILHHKQNSPLKNVITDEDYIRHNLLKYNINFLEKEMKIEHNLTRVRHLATGFMMVQRHVIAKMFEAFPSSKYIDDVNFLSCEENKFAYALFDCGVEDGHYFSEDWLFCHRWTKMGGDIWIDVSISLAHQGMETYNGFVLSTLH